jgi:hypothetical protein
MMKIQSGISVLLIAFCAFTSCTFSKRPGHTHREVYLVSGGFNASYGNVAIRIKDNHVNIDTSFFPENNLFDFQIDSSYIKKNRSFKTDIQLSLKKKHVFSTLYGTDIKILKGWSEKSHETKNSYSIQDIKFTENNETITLTYYIPAKPKESKDKCEQFLFELYNAFPYNGTSCKFVTQFYLN